MKISLTQLRKIIKEEILKGVPDFKYDVFAEECVMRVRDEFEKFLQSNTRSQNDKGEYEKSADEIFKDLQKEIVELIQSKLTEILNKHPGSIELLSQHVSKQQQG